MTQQDPNLPPPIMRPLGGAIDHRRELDLSRPIGFDEEGEPIFGHEVAEGPSIPGPCLRMLTVPPGRADCPRDCAGKQEDGGCLVDLIRRAQELGYEYELEVDLGGYWHYAGPPLDA